MVWDAKENTLLLLLYAVLSPPGRYDCCVYKGRKYYPCRPWLIVACLPLYLPVIFCCSSGLHAWARVSPLDACSWSSSWCVSALRVVCGSRKNQANLPHCRMVPTLILLGLVLAVAATDRSVPDMCLNPDNSSVAWSVIMARLYYNPSNPANGLSPVCGCRFVQKKSQLRAVRPGLPSRERL